MREYRNRTNRKTSGGGARSSSAGKTNKNRSAGRNTRRSGQSKRMRKVLLNAISSRNYTPMRAQDLAWLLGIPKTARKEMEKALEDLMQAHQIMKDENGRYIKLLSPAAAAGEREKEIEAEDLRRRPHSAAGTDRPEKPEPRRLTPGEEALLRDDPGADLTEVLLGYDIPLAFPQKVLVQAGRLPDGPEAGDYAGRTDFRGKTVITIDGDDSKDFDDAVSLERNGSGYVLGVHIADVTHYVAAGSALDREALKRGTSVYIPDRVIPMLPEKLSNGICSLNEGEDRLTLSCIVWLDHDANIIKTQLCESVICSAHRMTYGKVDRIFDHDPELTKEYADIVPMLFDMRELSAKMTEKRQARGMIDFDFPETKFELDEKRHPVRIRASVPTESTRLIEQFMLTANEVVAKTFSDLQVPFIYRTHERPDADKIETALSVVREMGIRAEKKGQYITPKEVQRMISEAADSPKSGLVSTVLLRSMQQARYTTENSGHFGLAAKNYCHFTSPIRRYPDLQIHRIIKDRLNGRLDARKTGYYKRILDGVAWKSSALERRAVEAERACIKIKMTEYALDHLNEESDGVITGVTEWGFYVQLPDTVEGLVPVRTLQDDYYEPDEKGIRLVGRRTGRTYELGQTVHVRIKSADVDRRQIDFSI